MGPEAEVRAELGRLAIDNIDSFWVYHGLLVLLLETAAGRVAGLLRAHAHVVKFGLLGSHVAMIAIESAHGSLSTAVEGRLRISDGYTCFLGCRQLLNETVGRTRA